MTVDAIYGHGPGEPQLVSVIIPTYQRAGLLSKAIESVLAQTHRNVEIIVVDDGSTDDTEQVVARYGSAVRYLRQANSGVSAARNLGLRQARGEFIALLDSDDLWLPWKLEAQLALLKRRPEVGMVWTDMQAIDEAGTLLAPTYLRTYYGGNYAKVKLDEIFASSGAAAELGLTNVPELKGRPFYVGEIYGPMLLGNLVHTSTVVLRRERLRQVGGFDVSLKHTGEDYDFHLRTCFYGPVALLDVAGIQYRIGAADQLSGPRLNRHMAQNNLRTLEMGLARLTGPVPLPRSLVRRRFAESYTWLGREELKEGNAAAARRHLLKSLSNRPCDVNAATLLLLSYLPRNLTQIVRRAWQTIKVAGRGGRASAAK